MIRGNPFAQRENWGHWLAAAVVGLLVAAFLVVVLSKLGGQSNRPDVERAMQPPPREEPAPASASETGAAAGDAGGEASAGTAADAVPPSQPGPASGTIRR